MTIRVIDSSTSINILQQRQRSGLILSALNLFMLGFFKEQTDFPQSSLFWCDGLLGARFVRAKGIDVKQLRGVDMLRAILAAHKGQDVSVLGSCNAHASACLARSGVSLKDHFSLEGFQPESFVPHDLHLTTQVAIIALPSPKQELLALKLAALPQNAAVNFYCIGGALNMLASPELDCPAGYQKIGLEFVFRLRTDTKRRLRRLFESAAKACSNWKYLCKQSVSLIQPDSVK
jgi:hypothetical protein